jgi:site-specific DNA-cytosine methylase
LYCKFNVGLLRVAFERINSCQFYHINTYGFCTDRKRLGLPIEAIVHIEHDPVAVHVIKWNHKHDGIKHTYIEKFEDIYGNDSDPNVNKLDELVSQHGVFVLVTSGAPCQNLSGLNACRDVDALNAQYLMKVGKLIKRLDLLQRSNGMEERILFLSENVVFHEYEQFDVHYSDFSPEGLSPMRVDAKDVGPVKRNRLYWMNVSVLVVCIAPAVANLILLSFLASTDASEQL